MIDFDEIDLVEGVTLPEPQPEPDLPLCGHYSVSVEKGGWTLEVDPDSPYLGFWVHGDPACRRPKVMEGIRHA